MYSRPSVLDRLPSYQEADCDEFRSRCISVPERRTESQPPTPQAREVVGGILKRERSPNEGNIGMISWKRVVIIVYWTSCTLSYQSEDRKSQKNARLAVSRQVDTPQIANTSIAVHKVPPMQRDLSSGPCSRPIVCVRLILESVFLRVFRADEYEGGVRASSRKCHRQSLKCLHEVKSRSRRERWRRTSDSDSDALATLRQVVALGARLRSQMVT